MKKIVLITLLSLSVLSAQIKVQGQVSTLGSGLGVGIGMKVIPIILDVGLEVQTTAIPSLSEKGTKKVDGVPTAYDGKFSYSATNIGGYLQLHIPAINLIPVVNIIANPIIHFGSINGSITVDGIVSALGQDGVIADNTIVQGSYLRLGLPFYIGPIYLEASMGTQKLAIAKVGQFESIPDVQLALGVQFF